MLSRFREKFLLERWIDLLFAGDAAPSRADHAVAALLLTLVRRQNGDRRIEKPSFQESFAFRPPTRGGIPAAPLPRDEGGNNGRDRCKYSDGLEAAPVGLAVCVT